MEKTLQIDADALSEARLACGASTDESPIRQSAYQRLRKLRGSEIGASDVRRRREPVRTKRKGKVA